MTDDDTTTTVEEVQRGYHVRVESKRGTGTRDQDKVELEAWTETTPTDTDLDELTTKVERVMNEVRSMQPDDKNNE